MKIATIIPLAKGTFSPNLTYFSTKDVKVGDIVLASLRSKKILGLVAVSEEASGAKGEIKEMNFNLRKILEVKESSLFKPELIQSVLDIGTYFADGSNNIIPYMIPSVMKENYDKIAKIAQPTPIIRKNKEPVEIRADKLIFQSNYEERMSSYKTLIRGSFAEKKSVFLVLPTENEVNKYFDILSKGVENFAWKLHSGITPKKLLKSIEDILTTEHPILAIGTAPYLAVPRDDFGTIILEKEGANAYKTISKPNFDLRTFVEVYAFKINAKLILSDTFLRFETIARKELDGLNPVHPLSFRTSFEGSLEIIEKGERFEVLMDQSLKEIKDALDKKKNVFIFTLRKGLATMTVCRDCNNILVCNSCESPLVLYLSRDGKKRMFICNKCHADIDPKTYCRHCSSWNLMPLGIGTDTVHEVIKHAFPKVKIFQLDKENAKTGKGAIKIAESFEESAGSIMIGTEMALFYLKKKIPLSVIASFESLWNIPNFKIREKIVSLLLSILNITSDKLLIQTKNQNDEAIGAIRKENLLSFVREELHDREKFGYPPYKRFIKITHLGNKEDSEKAKTALKEVFSTYDPEIFSGFVGKQKDKYVTNALIKLETKDWSLPEISIGGKINQDLLNKLKALPKEFTVTVDPEDLL